MQTRKIHPNVKVTSLSNTPGGPSQYYTQLSIKRMNNSYEGVIKWRTPTKVDAYKAISLMRGRWQTGGAGEVEAVHPEAVDMQKEDLQKCRIILLLVRIFSGSAPACRVAQVLCDVTGK